jgi:hypothetical protein
LYPASWRQIAPGDSNVMLGLPLKGVQGVFLMNRLPSDTSFHQFLDAAKSAGISKLVFLSTILANDASFKIGKLHKDQEDAIRASGLPAAFVRPGGFMSNAPISGFHPSRPMEPFTTQREKESRLRLLRKTLPQ